MNRIVIYLGLLVISLLSKAFGQETFEKRANLIANEIERITKNEKATLKAELEKIDEELRKGSISKADADARKSIAAQDAASRIEKRVAAEQAKLTDLVKEKVEGRIAALDTTSNAPTENLINIRWRKKVNKVYKEKRTTSNFVFAAGVNNLVTNGAVANSDFRYWGSHFYEVGMNLNTRILKNDNLLHFTYGLSLQYNNLRPTSNRTFVETNGQTNLETSILALKDSRFRTYNLVAPLYLEFDFSKRGNQKDNFRNHLGTRLGLGGYLGARLGAKQVLEFEDFNGNCVEMQSHGNFNTNDFVYGLGMYIGHRDTTLYIKYDLNPMFKSNTVSQNNISLGLRLDL